MTVKDDIVMGRERLRLAESCLSASVRKQEKADVSIEDHRTSTGSGVGSASASPAA